MRIIKVLGAILGLLLLTMVFPVALSVLGRSLLGLAVLFVVLLVVAAVTWGRRMDAIASKPWFIRHFDRGATQAHDRLLQDDDAMRERNSAQQRRYHDAE